MTRVLTLRLTVMAQNLSSTNTGDSAFSKVSLSVRRRTLGSLLHNNDIVVTAVAVIAYL